MLGWDTKAKSIDNSKQRRYLLRIGYTLSFSL
jgi:hypothetical protein